LTGFDPQGQPIIDTRFAETALSAANGQTIVIAGLRQRQDIGTFSGVPYLKNVRGVGKLFRSRDTTVRESELVVFISAEIIGPCEPLNEREAQIVDTVGCRLNQVPQAEGCPPPCECAPAMPLRLPEPELDYAEELPPMAARAALEQTTPQATIATRPPVVRPTRSTIRRLPTVDREVVSASANPQSSLLFGAPPAPTNSGRRADSDSPYRSGGAVQFGSPRVGDLPAGDSRLRR